MLSASNTLAGGGGGAGAGIGGGASGTDRGKLRVRYQDLKDLCEGRGHVGGGSIELEDDGSRNVGGNAAATASAGTVDSVGKMLKLLDSLGLEERRGGRKSLGTAAP
jgi:hypothetical protein